jgi:N-acetylneuraminate lyase
MTPSITLTAADRNALLHHYRHSPNPSLRTRAHILFLLADGKDAPKARARMVGVECPHPRPPVFSTGPLTFLCGWGTVRKTTGRRKGRADPWSTVMTTAFGGIWPAVLTPLAPDGSPAFAVLEQLTDLFARQGLGGLYIGGSTGQWPLLTLEERCNVAACVVRAAAGRIPVMVHVGACTTADAVALARHAARVGADAVSAVAPIYYPHPADAVFEHYRQVGAATELPLFIYHLNIVNQLTLDTQVYAERLAALPHIAGMKITDRDPYTFGLLHAFTGSRLRLFSGADEVMCHAVLCGAVGAIGTFYNLWGPACRRAREAFCAGSVEAGRVFMLRFQTAIAEILASGGVWTFLRSAMRLKHGIDVGMPRPPLGATDRPWADADVERLIDLVDSAP